jgi:ribosomal protein S18 acetylase RimI-like enzyme
VLLRAGSRGARVYSLAVDPRWQGRGVGSRLLRAAESRAADHGCTFIRLEVRADNARAIRQYVRAGYAEIGAKPAYYDDGEMALRFEKSLAPVEGTQPDR